MQYTYPLGPLPVTVSTPLFEYPHCWSGCNLLYNFREEPFSLKKISYRSSELESKGSSHYILTSQTIHTHYHILRVVSRCIQYCKATLIRKNHTVRKDQRTALPLHCLHLPCLHVSSKRNLKSRPFSLRLSTLSASFRKGKKKKKKSHLKMPQYCREREREFNSSDSIDKQATR